MAEFDFDNVHEFQGEVIRLNWRNPHVELSVRVEQEDGSERIIEIEAQDINTMSRRGLTAELIDVGDIVRIAGHLSQRRPNAMSVNNLLLPSGTEIRFRGNPEPRWNTSDIVGFGSVFGSGQIEDILATADLEAGRAQGLFRVWMRARAGGFPSELPLTESAIAHRQDWTEEDDPNITCTVPGMPSAMRINPPHPIELIQQENGDIIVHVEFFDVFRTVHMNAGSMNPSPSPLGYSVGRWDGEALVVETTNVDWPFFDNMAQIPLGQSVDISERYELTEDGLQLRYSMSVTDPSTFTETIEGNWLLDWWPNLEMQEYDCVPPEHG